MIMPVKYTPEMVAEAIALRESGEKWVVLYELYGEGIQSAMRRVQGKTPRRVDLAVRCRDTLLQRVLDSGALLGRAEELESDIRALLEGTAPAVKPSVFINPPPS